MHLQTRHRSAGLECSPSLAAWFLIYIRDYCVFVLIRLGHSEDIVTERSLWLLNPFSWSLHQPVDSDSGLMKEELKYVGTGNGAQPQDLCFEAHQAAGQGLGGQQGVCG